MNSLINKLREETDLEAKNFKEDLEYSKFKMFDFSVLLPQQIPDLDNDFPFQANDQSMIHPVSD